MKTHSLDGDLSIGRNLAMGGDAAIRGNARVNHNLRVDGWLDAPNIKQPCMGLFPTANALYNAFPYPQPGWWALVGTQLPAGIFISIDGHWQFTGNTGGNPHIDLSEFTQQIHSNAIEIADMQSQIDILSESLRELSENPGWGTGGGMGGTIVAGASFSIAYRQNPIYVSQGSASVIDAAIRSVSVEADGSMVPNAILRVDVYDAVDNLPLLSLTQPWPSSASLSDFSFSIDVSSLIPSAGGTRDFVIEATDDTGAKRRKQISVVCVDATVEVSGVQTLHYTASSALVVDGSPRSIPLFRFPANSSRQGILCRIDAYYVGEWRSLGTVNVLDNFPHSITINPTNLLGGGERLDHGALPLRIQGTDVASGVAGNIAYTAVMCVAPANSTPVVAVRYDAPSSTVRLYDSVKLEVAAYQPGHVETELAVHFGDYPATSLLCSSTQTYAVSQQVLGYPADGSATFDVWATAGRISSLPIEFRVLGSVIDMEVKDGADFCLDFSNRHNSETTHAISDKGVTMTVEGMNWDTNGFVPCLGEQSLRIAENASAEIGYTLFGPSCQATGCVLQMAFATDNVLDPDALVAQCWLPGTGAGFYVKGNKVAICCQGGSSSVQERSFPCGRKVTISVVAEPSTTAIPRGSASFAFLKLYIEGEEAAAIAYNAAADSLSSPAKIRFDGSAADISVFYVMAYGSHLAWKQAFSNYLVKVTDTSALVAEAQKEDVLDSAGIPSMGKMKELGMPYCVVVAPQEVFDDFDSGTDTSQKFSCTLFYFNPQQPCLSFRADNVQWRRQGTTSAKRPVKNDRFYLDKPVDKNLPTTITLLSPDESTQLGREAIALAERNYIRLAPDSIPVKVVTVKVDFSDSSGANDSGVCDMMNATFRALGHDFLTPAQRAYDGTFCSDGMELSGLVLDHSTHNHPIACFRATSMGMVDAYFHAKGNWKEDKGEQLALGFRDTPGYNKGCLNYGDFVEFFALPDETLDQAEARFKRQSGLDQEKPYVISMYCGRDYRVMRYINGQWRQSPGSMNQGSDGRWVVTGDVLNPVTGFELLSYEGMCWWQGVLSVEDMMRPSTQKSAWVQKLVDTGKLSTEEFPAWTFYFECMVDNDQLAIDLAMGRKVPYELYRMLQFCSSHDYSAFAREQWAPEWKEQLRLYASPQSLMAYYLFTDYLAAVDQRAKNMQPMWFLEDGESVANGVYSSEGAVRMYLNKIYDCDTCNGKDNDGGCSVASECDPDKPSVAGAYSNPYAGWGSVLFNNMRLCPELTIDSQGSLLSLPAVAAAMRGAQMSIGGSPLAPFSPQGARKFFLEDRIMRWPKLVSSYDGERKYLRSISHSDSVYAYALQGLGLTALPQFIEERWRFRDGCYRTGLFFSGVLSGRIACQHGAAIRFRAAKDGYFGIGNDASGNLSESVYLRAGEEHAFTQFSHQTGALLYIYQADRMAMLDLSEISLDSTFDFSALRLCSELILGGPGKQNLEIGSYAPLSMVALGSLPFLRSLDLRGTLATGVDASLCPRLESILAEDSQLASCSIAPGAPLSSLTLPSTIAQLSLSRLSQLSYPGGLQCQGFDSLSKLVVADCPLIDVPSILLAAGQAGALRQVRCARLKLTAPPDALLAVAASGAIGIAANGTPYAESGQCSGISGKWFFPSELDSATLASLRAYFPQLYVGEMPYSSFLIEEDANGHARIVNGDNGSIAPAYTPSGHFLRAVEKIQPAWGTFNAYGFTGTKVSKENYQRLADGSEYDFSDSLGSGKNLMVAFPKLYFKAVNDPLRRRQHVYLFCPKTSESPQGMGETIVSKYYSSLSPEIGVRLDAGAVAIGEALTPSARVADSSSVVYSIPCYRMKMARWSARAAVGAAAVFVDTEGYVLAVEAFDSLPDGFLDGDSLIASIPDGAAQLLVTAPAQAPLDAAAIVADSDEPEPLESAWTLVQPFVIGAYQASYDTSRSCLRSLSGKQPVTQTTATATNTAWKILKLAEVNYGCAVSYGMRKAIALLYLGYSGRLDSQDALGYGTSSPGLTGQLDSIGVHCSARTASMSPNKCLGIENFFGVLPEIIGNVAVNVESYSTFYANDGISSATDPINGVLHTKDGHEVQLPLSQGSVARLKLGHRVDILPCAVVADEGPFADKYIYSPQKARIVLAGGASASPDAGLFAFDASRPTSESSLKVTTRIAYQGSISIS